MCARLLGRSFPRLNPGTLRSSEKEGLLLTVRQKEVQVAAQVLPVSCCSEGCRAPAPAPHHRLPGQEEGHGVPTSSSLCRTGVVQARLCGAPPRAAWRWSHPTFRSQHQSGKKEKPSFATGCPDGTEAVRPLNYPLESKRTNLSMIS